MGIPVRHIEGDPLKSPVITQEACAFIAFYTFDPSLSYSTYRAGDGSRIVGLSGQKGSGKTLATRFFVEELGYTEAVYAGPLKYAVEPIVAASGEEGPFAWDHEPFKMRTITMPALTHDAVHVAFCRMAGVYNWETGDPLPNSDKYAMPYLPKNLSWALHMWSKYYKANLEGKTITIRQLLQQFGTDMGRALTDDLWSQALMPALENPLVVVDGVRFVNDAKFLRERGALIIGITRDRGTYHLDNHSSELEMRGRWGEIVDVTVENNFDSIVDLHKALRKVRP
jgi:hypothetical protein